MDSLTRISTDSLLRRSFALFSQGLSLFVPIAFVALVPLGLLMSTGPTVPEMVDPTDLSVLLYTFALIFASLVFVQLAIGGVVLGVFRRLRGATVTVEECLRAAGRRWGALVVTAILVGLATIAGVALCIVPGIIVAVGLFVAVPALMVEQASPTEAMRRSWTLTEGHRLPIFFVVLTLFLLGLGVSVLSGMVMTAFGVLASTLVDFGWQVIAAAFQGVFAAVAYHDLRVVKEGLGEDELAAVFD